jgi:O-antigen ligase
LGTIGNPNNNAILFLFFCVLFIPKKLSGTKDWIWFFVAYLFFLTCQSRTGVIAFAAMSVLAMWLFQYSRTKIIIMVMCIVGGLTILKTVQFVQHDDKSYIGSMADGEALSKTNSVKGRLEVWNLLWEMIKQKPFFGHAPSKDFFYNNQLYSESEYVLMTWRYGFVGLLLYLLLILYPLAKAIKFKDELLPKQLILFTVVILITAITNNPLSNPSIFLMFAVMVSLFYFRDKLMPVSA